MQGLVRIRQVQVFILVRRSPGPGVRDKDRMHLREMLDVNLIDASWRDRLTPPLADRLRELLADPDG